MLKMLHLVIFVLLSSFSLAVTNPVHHTELLAHENLAHRHNTTGWQELLHAHVIHHNSVHDAIHAPDSPLRVALETKMDTILAAIKEIANSMNNRAMEVEACQQRCDNQISIIRNLTEALADRLLIV